MTRSDTTRNPLSPRWMDDDNTTASTPVASVSFLVGFHILKDKKGIPLHVFGKFVFTFFFYFYVIQISSGFRWRAGTIRAGFPNLFIKVDSIPLSPVELEK